MQVNMLGFEWTLGRGVTLEQFWGHLNGLRLQAIKFRDYDRLVYTAEKENYFVGLLLTIKDQKKVPEITKNQGEFKVVIRELDGKTNLVDFNFFVVNKATQRGLYQFYHHSCALNQLGLFLRAQYDEFKDRLKSTEIQGLGNTPKAQREIGKKYKGTLQWEMFVKTENIENLLLALDTLSFFEFELTTLSVKEAVFRPVHAHVKKEKHNIRFIKGSTPVDLASSLVSIVQQTGIQRGRIAGKNSDGIEEVYRIANNPDSYAEYEFDDIANDTTLALNSISDSPLVDKMISVMKERPAIFERRG